MSRPITTPADILSDEIDHLAGPDGPIRKGTVAAFVVNARAYEDETDPERSAALRSALMDAVPALRAIGVLDVLTPRSPRVADAVEAAVPTD